MEIGVPAAQPRMTGLPLPYAVAAAASSGAAMMFAFPPYGLWWLAPAGVALLAVAVHRRRLRSGFGLGVLAGATLFVPLLAWTNLHTGKLPWLLLSMAEAVVIGLLGAASAWVSPLIDRRRALWPLLAGVLWVAQEALRDRAPFGGFPWGRLAFSQGDAPALRLAAYGGAPLVTFAVAAAGGAFAAVAWPYLRREARPAPVGLLGFTAAAAAVVAGPALLPVGTLTGPPVTVAVVQGNVPRLGLDFNEQRRRVLDNHATATEQLAQRVAAGLEQQPDLVVWPENSSDIDPLLNADAAARIQSAADDVEAPILVGAVLRGPGPGQVRNAGLLWLPGTGPDLPQLYIKRHPVPFAEYVPLRDIARMVTTEVDRVTSDFVAGTTAGVVRAGPVVFGDVICFEVAYDDIVRDTVTGGAQIIAVQTNNATFDPAEANQQLAMVRLRAVEHGRAALMASTVGVSALVDPDGTVRSRTEFNTPAVIVGQMAVDGRRTLATRAGMWPELALTVVALAGLAWAALRRRDDRRGARPAPTEPVPDPEPDPEPAAEPA